MPWAPGAGCLDVILTFNRIASAKLIEHRGGRTRRQGSRISKNVVTEPHYLALVYMSSEVFGQIIRPGETFAAHLAVIGPFPGVNAEMPGEVAFPAESAAAEETYERSFARVLAHVKLQVLFGPDALTAKGTGEATLAPVHFVAAACQADDRIRRLGTIVVHRVVVRLADLAGTAGRTASVSSWRLGHLHLDGLSRVLL